MAGENAREKPRDELAALDLEGSREKTRITVYSSTVIHQKDGTVLHRINNREVLYANYVTVEIVE